MRVTTFPIVFAAIAAVLALAGPLQAAIVVFNQNNPPDTENLPSGGWGSYQGFSVTFTDPALTQVAGGIEAGTMLGDYPTVYLTDLVIRRSGSSGATDANNVLLKVYSTQTPTTGSFVGESSNRGDMRGGISETNIAFTFDHLALFPDTKYHFYFADTADNEPIGDIAWRQGRLRASNHASVTYPSGNLINASWGNQDTAYDAVFAATFASEPLEPPAPFRVLASYDSGVAATAGAGGAANPLTQGWTSSGGSNVWADGYDSGQGGWRIVDGASTDHMWYGHALSAQDVSEMARYGWTLDFTLSLDSDARNSAGGFVSNYYLPPNHERQNNQVMWIENESGGYRYIVHFQTDEDSNLFAYDQTTWHQLTSDGSAYDDFKSMRIAFTDDIATLSFDEQAFVLATSGTPGAHRLVFGASSVAGQGSAIWNHVTLTTIPEPGTLVLLATALLALPGRRRRRR